MTIPQKKKYGKVAKLVWLAAVQLFYFLSFFFFSYIPKRKKRRKRSKTNFWKGMIKTNVCCNAVPDTQPPLSSINQAQGVFLQVDAAVLHLHNINHSSCMPVASSSKPSRKTLPQLLRPQYAMKLGYCQCCFLQSDEQKKVQMRGLWTTKSTTRTQRRFPVTLSFMQKSDLQTGHLSEDRSRSFAWNLE